MLCVCGSGCSSRVSSTGGTSPTAEDSREAALVCIRAVWWRCRNEGAPLNFALKPLPRGHPPPLHALVLCHGKAAVTATCTVFGPARQRQLPEPHLAASCCLGGGMHCQSANERAPAQRMIAEAAEKSATMRGAPRLADGTPRLGAPPTAAPAPSAGAPRYSLWPARQTSLAAVERNDGLEVCLSCCRARAGVHRFTLRNTSTRVVHGL